MYQYIVVPRDNYTNEVLTAELARTNSLTGNEKTFQFDNKQKSGYYVKHEFITRLKNAKDRRMKYEFYSQVDGGAIRKYSIPAKKADQKVKKASHDLSKLKK